MKLVQFVPNVPQELRLGIEISPVKLSGGAGCLFTLADGRLLHVSANTAQALADLRLTPEETFMLILHDRPGFSYMVAWLSSATEKSRAAAQAPELERQLEDSLRIVSRGGRPRPAVLDLPATGTDGPAPQRQPAIAAAAGGKIGKPGPRPIPADVAFGEILEFIARKLKAGGMQWNDQAVQDFASTVWISGCKAGWISLWDRQAA